tara:strand:+ start:8130 stop:8651 length:522 start_codon:yes stop_codon:yes gene_type:complete
MIQIHGRAYEELQNSYFNTFSSDAIQHAKMVRNVFSSTSELQPLVYIKLQVPRSKIENSSENALSSAAKEYYDSISSELNLLNDKDQGQEVIEEGAINTALSLIESLKNAEYSPPKVTWHGGDAVVMLWAVGDTTYAITVTDNELGYVVRRNRKSIRSNDSIVADKFKLEDLR